MTRTARPTERDARSTAVACPSSALLGLRQRSYVNRQPLRAPG